MSDLVAIAYPDLETAKQVAANTAQLQKSHEIELEDLVVVERKADGKVKLHQPSAGRRGRRGRRAVGRPDRADLLHAAARHGVGAAAGAAAERSATTGSTTSS